MPAGERDASGRYPEGTVNRRVDDRLAAFAEKARSFARGNAGAAVPRSRVQVEVAKDRAEGLPREKASCARGRLAGRRSAQGTYPAGLGRRTEGTMPA